MKKETINSPKPRTIRSPNRSTSFPEKSPETKRIIAKLEITRPIKVFETPKLFAKIGIAGIITPKPIATRNEIEVSTETSRGSPANGERGFNLKILRMRLGVLLHAPDYLEVASLLRRVRKRIR